ncbi:MAG TPA: SDR family oxidoreductase [Tepidiformaceae bacterium]|nr:SDR family oxidoreductase [Tepidiformaceae bacterium]
MEELFSIRGKVAVVTGGSRGIGLMIARGFVEAGARTYISSRKADVCDEVAAELSKVGECVSIPADLGSEAGCRYLAEEVAKREEKLHILVNNAGANWNVPLGGWTDEAWDKVMDLNLKGVFHLTRFMLPLLEKAASDADPARVINIGSVDGLSAPGFETYAYAASKAGVHHLTRHMAQQFGRKRITVNAIAPGPFESKMMAETLRRFGEGIRAGNPMGRIGEPSDMAGTAIYLASKAGSYVNGVVLPVDGGASTRHQ